MSYRDEFIYALDPISEAEDRLTGALNDLQHWLESNTDRDTALHQASDAAGDAAFYSRVQAAQYEALAADLYGRPWQALSIAEEELLERVSRGRATLADVDVLEALLMERTQPGYAVRK